MSKKYKITFDFSGKSSDRKIITKITQALNEVVFFNQERSFSLAIVSSAEIKKWNLIYRGKNKVTDVLSFAELDTKEKIPLLESQVKDLGEIIICEEVMKRQAKVYGWSRNQELARLLTHGLAHLCGYEHENVSPKTALKMLELEKKILQRAGFDF